MLAYLRNGGQQKPEKRIEDKPDFIALIVPRKRAAELLGGSCRSIDRLAAQGLLEKVVLPDRKKSAGISKESLLGLLNKTKPLDPERDEAKR